MCKARWLPERREPISDCPNGGLIEGDVSSAFYVKQESKNGSDHLVVRGHRGPSRRASSSEFVERMISIEEVGHWKPHRDVYLHAAKCVKVEPHQVALVAAHAWDIHGAGRAGLTTGFVARSARYPATMMAPHVVAESLDRVAKQLVEIEQRQEQQAN